MIPEIKSLEQFTQVINSEKATLVYFSHSMCNVCTVLKPKIEDLLKTHFPLISMHYCDTIERPEIAAQNSIFTVPTLVIYFEGKEYIRKSRNVGIADLQNTIERPYLLMFTD
ncbi:MAG: thioredoxin family protein [Bacteroidales bacterium]